MLIIYPEKACATFNVKISLQCEFSFENKESWVELLYKESTNKNVKIPRQKKKNAYSKHLCKLKPADKKHFGTTEEYKEESY